MPKAITFSNYRVDCVEPSDPEHQFETRCSIVADDAQFNGDTVRVFDVPDPDEGQRTVAAFACKAMNSHDALYEAIDKAQARLDDLPDFLYRNNHDVLAGIVAETLTELRAALTVSDGFNWQDRRAAAR